MKQPVSFTCILLMVYEDALANKSFAPVHQLQHCGLDSEQLHMHLIVMVGWWVQLCILMQAPSVHTHTHTRISSSRMSHGLVCGCLMWSQRDCTGNSVQGLKPQPPRTPLDPPLNPSKMQHIHTHKHYETAWLSKSGLKSTILVFSQTETSFTAPMRDTERRIS